MTFPNILVLNYLKQTKQASPEIQLKAENYIALGYQRLLTFEVGSGGFSLFGSPPASIMLSAKGLLEFSDMTKVFPVDPALIDRTRKWLLGQQRGDGAWSVSSSWDQAGDPQDRLPLTAYVTWALLEAGARDDPGVVRAIGYIKENAAGATDAYTLALVANALVAFEPGGATSQEVLAHLARTQTVEADAGYWGSKGTFTGAYGSAASVEATGLAAYAFLRGQAYPEVAQRALNYLIQKKDPRGTWGTTQGTILALRALVQAALAQPAPTQPITIRTALNGAQAGPIVITPQNAGVVQLLTFDDVKPGTNRVSFRVEGQGNLTYQVSASYYIPWEIVPPEPETSKLVDIQVRYDRTTLAVDDTANVTVQVSLTKEGTARMTLVDLGVPPGFTVVTDGLDASVKNKTISRYELAGRQIIVYLENLAYRKPVTFDYALKAKFPLRAKTPSSTLYDYYNPEVGTTKAPLQLTVK